MIKGSTEKIKAIFSHSKWIWPDDHRWDMHNAYALFRKKIVLEKVPKHAPLYITADQSYQLYINGHYICRGPARGFQAHWPFDEVDVAKYLLPGENLIAIRAHNPGFSNFQYLTQGYAGLLVAAQWGKTNVVSDKTWKGRRQTGVSPATVPTSLQLFCQEHIDLRVESPDWMKPEFDDASWNSPMPEHPWDGMPWYSLEERGIPLLSESLWDKKINVVGISQGSNNSGYRTARDVAKIRFLEGLAHEKASFSAEVIKVEPVGEGRYRSYLIDFGTTVVGSVGFKISGAVGGEIIDTLHAETVNKETLAADFIPEMHCRMAFAHRLTCRPGTQKHFFYHPFGFRYMILTVRDLKSNLEIAPYLRLTLYPHEKKGDFASSDNTLKNIWETCAWTERVCSLDAYVDTPWREQAQWWGDARVQAKNTFFYSGDTRLFRRGIAQIASQTLPNGLTYGHSPTMAHNCILPDFSLIWIITIWDYYWQTGSLEPFLAHQEEIQGVLRYFEEKMGEGKHGLAAYDKRYWLFLDWTDLFKEGYSTVYNLWLLLALERVGKMYSIAKKQTEARKFSSLANKLRKGLGKLISKDGLLFDGFTYEGKLVREISIHSQVMAILADFFPKHNKTRIDKIILPYINGYLKAKAMPSSYWVTYVLQVLTEHGYPTKVIEFIRERWKPMIDHGTTWEVFIPEVAHESFSHAWSAHPLYHLMETIGGVRQVEAGWKKIIFEPCIYGDRGSSTIPTPSGLIVSSWEKKGEKIHASLSLPKGVTAEVVLPGTKKTLKMTGKKNWILSGKK